MRSSRFRKMGSLTRMNSIELVEINCFGTSCVVSRVVISPESKERRCYEAREEMIVTTQDAVKYKAEKKKTRDERRHS